MVQGGWVDAVAVIGGPPSIYGAEVSGSQALAYFARGAASGGALGRRRGLAAARLDVWLLVSALSGDDPDDVNTPGNREQCVRDLQWVVWNSGEPETGWSTRIAIHDAK